MLIIIILGIKAGLELKQKSCDSGLSWSQSSKSLLSGAQQQSLICSNVLPTLENLLAGGVGAGEGNLQRQRGGWGDSGLGGFSPEATEKVSHVAQRLEE